MRKIRSAKAKAELPAFCRDADHCTRCSEDILRWTILANIFLVVITLTGGYLSGSVGLIADGTHSICCIISSCVVAYSVKVSKRKRDSDFPFGYGKLEIVASLAVYGILFGLGIFVVLSSLSNVFTNPGHSPSLVGLPIALTAVLVLYMLYRYNYCAGKKLNSQGIAANAQNSKADMLTSCAVSLGIILSQFGPSFAIFDSVAALLVGLFIIKDSIGLWLADFKLILDQLPEPGFREKILAEVSKTFPGTVKLLKPKRLGRKFWIGLSLQMPEDSSIGDWEAVQSRIEKQLLLKVDGVGEVDFFLTTS